MSVGKNFTVAVVLLAWLGVENCVNGDSLRRRLDDDVTNYVILPSATKITAGAQADYKYCLDNKCVDEVKTGTAWTSAAALPADNGKRIMVCKDTGTNCNIVLKVNCEGADLPCVQSKNDDYNITEAIKYFMRDDNVSKIYVHDSGILDQDELVKLREWKQVIEDKTHVTNSVVVIAKKMDNPIGLRAYLAKDCANFGDDRCVAVGKMEDMVKNIRDKSKVKLGKDITDDHKVVNIYVDNKITFECPAGSKCIKHQKDKANVFVGEYSEANTIHGIEAGEFQYKVCKANEDGCTMTVAATCNESPVYCIEDKDSNAHDISLEMELAFNNSNQYKFILATKNAEMPKWKEKLILLGDVQVAVGQNVEKLGKLDKTRILITDDKDLLGVPGFAGVISDVADGTQYKDQAFKKSTIEKSKIPVLVQWLRKTIGLNEPSNHHNGSTANDTNQGGSSNNRDVNNNNNNGTQDGGQNSNGTRDGGQNSNGTRDGGQNSNGTNPDDDGGLHTMISAFVASAFGFVVVALL